MDQLKPVPDPSYKEQIDALHEAINRTFLSSYLNLSAFDQSDTRRKVFQYIHKLYIEQYSAGYYAYATRINEYRLQIGAWLYYAPLEKQLNRKTFTHDQDLSWANVHFLLCKQFVQELLQKPPESIEIDSALDKSEQVLTAFETGMYGHKACATFNNWFMEVIRECIPRGKDAALLVNDYRRQNKTPAHVKLAPDPYRSYLHTLDKHIELDVLRNHADDPVCQAMWHKTFRPACIHFLRSILEADTSRVNDALMDIMVKLHAMRTGPHAAFLTALKSLIISWARSILIQYVPRSEIGNVEAIDARIQTVEANALRHIQHLSKHPSNARHSPPEPSSHIEHTPEVKALFVFVRQELKNTHKYNILMERRPKGTREYYYTLPTRTVDVHPDGFIQFIPLINNDAFATHIALIIADGLNIGIDSIPQLRENRSSLEWLDATNVFQGAVQDNPLYGQTIRKHLRDQIIPYIQRHREPIYNCIMEIHHQSPSGREHTVSPRRREPTLVMAPAPVRDGGHGSPSDRRREVPRHVMTPQEAWAEIQRWGLPPAPASGPYHSPELEKFMGPHITPMKHNS